MSSKSAFVLGASGMVGRQIAEVLMKNPAFSRIVLLGRRRVEIPDAPPHLEQQEIDFDNLDPQHFQGFDVGFCSLGVTTKAGKEKMQQVDHDYVVATAKLARENGATAFCLVTAAGSDPNATFWPFKIKGAAERDVAELGFEKFIVARPFLIEGPREEVSFGYRCSKLLLKPTSLFTTALLIDAQEIAKALISCTLDDARQGVQILSAAEMGKIAKQYKVEK
ncbi:unnamed protein product, partial [Mesorhabditis belari]|uniref:Semialdehyde dehydrogenase NAD-binding domain-containing protein n=1 Tax=Mesorhabditis belari TaxID=2138241 RepID=A0AAF3FDL2_9BILA